jgi:hypothetical protein
MKFWQLNSVLRDSNILNEILGQRPEWAKYRELVDHFDHYVEIQDRNVLDQVVDPELCRAALEAWGHYFWIDNDGYLREYRDEQDVMVTSDKLIRADDVYLQYGGDVLEDTLERGRVRVTNKGQAPERPDI